MVAADPEHLGPRDAGGQGQLAGRGHDAVELGDDDGGGHGDPTQPGPRVEPAEGGAGLEQSGRVVALELAGRPVARAACRPAGCAAPGPRPAGAGRRATATRPGTGRTCPRRTPARPAGRPRTGGPSRTAPGRRPARDGGATAAGRSGRPSSSRPGSTGRSPARPASAATSSAQSSRRNGRRLRMPRPWPRWSRAMTRNSRLRGSKHGNQLSPTVAVQPCRSTSTGAPGGPARLADKGRAPARQRGRVRPGGSAAGRSDLGRHRQLRVGARRALRPASRGEGGPVALPGPDAASRARTGW